MHIIKGLFYVSAAVLGTTSIAAPASAQASRTWVSGVGDDVNPCSRTAPCKTFQGTISKTAAGGEINCLDPGGFGAVTITKSISIICDNLIGGVLVTGTNGMIINAGTNDVVVLSGLDLEGFGGGLDGVRILQAQSVIVRNSTIRGFRGGTASGIGFRPANSGASLSVENVTIIGGAQNSAPTGIAIEPNTGISASFAIDNVRLTDNLGIGVSVVATGAGSLVKGTVTNSLFSDAGSAVQSVAASDNGVQLMIKNNVITGGANGIVADGAGSRLQVAGTVITQNSGVGVSAANGAVISTYQDNIVAGNTTNGAFSSTLVKK